MEDALEKLAVALAAALLVDLVDAPRRPGMHRRIDVAERPFVGRNWPFGCMYHSRSISSELLLGELRIDQRQRHAMERQIPGGVPGIFPLVGHGDDVGVVQMRPLVIAARRCAPAAGRIAGIALEPIVTT